jgi:hypothetical protein
MWLLKILGRRTSALLPKPLKSAAAIKVRIRFIVLDHIEVKQCKAGTGEHSAGLRNIFAESDACPRFAPAFTYTPPHAIELVGEKFPA